MTTWVTQAESVISTVMLPCPLSIAVQLRSLPGNMQMHRRIHAPSETVLLTTHLKLCEALLANSDLGQDPSFAILQSHRPG
jgi:hypothetical protein